MSRNTLVTAGIVIAVLVAGIWLLTNSKKTTPTPSYQATPSPASEVSASPSASPLSKNIVKVDSTGFVPQNITIKAGESVVWVNNNTVNHIINSAVHPTHQVYLSLNLGVLKPGEEKSLTFPTVGAYKYHNHLNPTLTGSVTVE